MVFLPYKDFSCSRAGSLSVLAQEHHLGRGAGVGYDGLMDPSRKPVGIVRHDDQLVARNSREMPEVVVRHWRRLSPSVQRAVFEEFARLCPPVLITTVEQTEAIGWIRACDADGCGRSRPEYNSWRENKRPDAPRSSVLIKAFGGWTKLRQAASGTVPDHRRARVVINPRLTPEQALDLLHAYSARYPVGALREDGWRGWAAENADVLLEGDVRIPVLARTAWSKLNCTCWEDACVLVGRSAVRSKEAGEPVDWEQVYEALRVYHGQHGKIPTRTQYSDWVGGENGSRSKRLGLPKFPSLRRIERNAEYPGWAQLLVDSGLLDPAAKHLVRQGRKYTAEDYAVMAGVYLRKVKPDPQTGLLWVSVNSLHAARITHVKETGMQWPSPSSYRKWWGALANGISVLIGEFPDLFPDGIHPEDIVSREVGGDD